MEWIKLRNKPFRIPVWVKQTDYGTFQFSISNAGERIIVDVDKHLVVRDERGFRVYGCAKVVFGECPNMFKVIEPRGDQRGVVLESPMIAKAKTYIWTSGEVMYKAERFWKKNGNSGYQTIGLFNLETGDEIELLITDMEGVLLKVEHYTVKVENCRVFLIKSEIAEQAEKTLADLLYETWREIHDLSN